MTQHIKCHPSMNLLELYCDGSLTAEVALVVAAHIDLCPHCQQLARDIETDQADLMATSGFAPASTLKATQGSGDEFAAMLTAITATAALQTPQTGHAEGATASVPDIIQFDQYRFTLPRALRQLAMKRSRWLSLSGIASCRLPSGEPHHLSLLVIDKQTDVPTHTHQGLEMTLVLAGEIVDEHGHYGPGDLIINTPDETHQPRNMSNEPCLCLSVLSAPLQFKTGLTRFLNPLQRFFY